MKAVFVVLMAMLVTGCASLAGNVGPVTLDCVHETPEGELRELRLEMPAGSGRVLESIDGLDSACGIELQGVAQGEDRTGGLWGLLRTLLLGPAG